MNECGNSFEAGYGCNHNALTKQAPLISINSRPIISGMEEVKQVILQRERGLARNEVAAPALRQWTLSV